MVKFVVSLVASQVMLESGPVERLLGVKAAERRDQISPEELQETECDHLF